MDEAIGLLDRQLKELGRTILTDGGRVKRKIADKHAEAEYKKFARRRKELRHKEADQTLSELAAEAKKLPRSRNQ